MKFEYGVIIIIIIIIIIKGTNIQYDRQINKLKFVTILPILSFRISLRASLALSYWHISSLARLIIKAMWEEAFAENVKHWRSTISSLPKNIYNFTQRYLNNSLPTVKNMSLSKKTTNSLCSF